MRLAYNAKKEEKNRLFRPFLRAIFSFAPTIKVLNTIECMTHTGHLSARTLSTWMEKNRIIFGHPEI